MKLFLLILLCVFSTYSLAETNKISYQNFRVEKSKLDIEIQKVLDNLVYKYEEIDENSEKGYIGINDTYNKKISILDEGYKERLEYWKKLILVIESVKTKNETEKADLEILLIKANDQIKTLQKALEIPLNK